MHASTTIRMFAAAAVLVAISVPAAGQPDAAKRTLIKTTIGGLPQLPEPLEGIPGNLHELEKDGLFTVTDVRVDSVGLDRQEAIVWTLQVNRAVTCRHAMMAFDGFRDVRFYRESEQSLLEVHSARLYFDEMIRTGAANAEALPRDSIVHAFIFLGGGDLVKLRLRKANQLVFTRAGENLFRNLPDSRPEKRTYEVPAHALVKQRDTFGGR